MHLVEMKLIHIQCLNSNAVQESATSENQFILSSPINIGLRLLPDPIADIEAINMFNLT